MEAVLFRSSLDQQVSPYKQHMRNSVKNNRYFISQASENFPPPNFRGGLLLAPPPPFLFHSYPSPVSRLNQSPSQQPPLLPLPISRPYNMNNSRSRGLSCPPVNRKSNGRTRDQSRTPEKPSKLSTSSPKKEELKPTNLKSRKMNTNSSDCLIIESTNRFGPDPKDLPKDVFRVLSFSARNRNYDGIVSDFSAMEQQLDKFSDCGVFTVSPPPPSSLPLPSFSMRPKLSCNAEAAGIDAGATDSLRRLLRLR